MNDVINEPQQSQKVKGLGSFFMVKTNTYSTYYWHITSFIFKKKTSYLPDDVCDY